MMTDSVGNNAALAGTYGSGRIILTGPDQDYHASPSGYYAQQYQLLLNELEWTGNGCDDSDEDGVCDEDDNCVDTANEDQADLDSDGLGDVCDTCPNDFDNDIDGDLVCGDVDNCVDTPNSDQANDDTDSLGNACDNCDVNDNDDQADLDNDGLGDVCDDCPNDADNDADGDTVCGDVDLCAGSNSPELTVPTSSKGLGNNRWVLGADGVFDQGNPGNGPFDAAPYNGVVTASDTAGCSCEQIIDACGLGNGHTKFGCSNGVTWNWVTSGGVTCDDE